MYHGSRDSYKCQPNLEQLITQIKGSFKIFASRPRSRRMSLRKQFQENIFITNLLQRIREKCSEKCT